MLPRGRSSRANERLRGARLPHGAIVVLDQELTLLARGAGELRLRIGEALELMRMRGWHHELGFSSLSAYSLERCQRSGRWASESGMLARRLVAFPRLRAALATAALGWSMVELLARHATPESEQSVLEQALKSTIRQMRVFLRERAQQ